MKLETLYQELVQLAKQHNIIVRREAGTFRGGSCLVNSTNVVVINKHSPLEIAVSQLAEVLSELIDTSQLYLKPAVRQVLEKSPSRKKQTQTEEVEQVTE